MFRKYFEGWYFKHQNENNTISIIPGVSHDKSFIQIITDNNSYNINFPKDQFKKGKNMRVSIRKIERAEEKQEEKKSVKERADQIRRERSIIRTDLETTLVLRVNLAR